MCYRYILLLNYTKMIYSILNVLKIILPLFLECTVRGEGGSGCGCGCLLVYMLGGLGVGCWRAGSL